MVYAFYLIMYIIFLRFIFFWFCHNNRFILQKLFNTEGVWKKSEIAFLVVKLLKFHHFTMQYFYKDAFGTDLSFYSASFIYQHSLIWRLMKKNAYACMMHWCNTLHKYAEMNYFSVSNSIYLFDIICMK